MPSECSHPSPRKASPLPVRDLPGCWSHRSRLEAEALDNDPSAIEEYLEAVATLTAGADVREVEIAVS